MEQLAEQLRREEVQCSKFTYTCTLEVKHWCSILGAGAVCMAVSRSVSPSRSMVAAGCLQTPNDAQNGCRRSGRRRESAHRDWRRSLGALMPRPAGSRPKSLNLPRLFVCACVCKLAFCVRALSHRIRLRRVIKENIHGCRLAMQ